MKSKIEIACFNVDSALIAQNNGADRVELCDQMSVGGTTPNIDDIIKVSGFLEIDLNIMIRPRGGDFIYTDQEFDQMKQDILRIKQLKVDGFVFGILDQNNKVDVIRNKQLVDLAHPLVCTFHRAFDVVENFNESLEDVIACGFSTILTSAGKQNVVQGKQILKELVERANDRICIMPGGGLRSNNLAEISQYTGAKYYHSSAITNDTQLASAAEVQALKAVL